MADENDNKNTQNKQKSKNPFSNLTGQDGKKPKFSFYWIYGILALVFLGLNFLNTGNEAKKTDWKDLKQMLQQKEVKKLVLVNKDVAEIYLTPGALQMEKYKKLKNSSNTFGQKTPQFYYNVASPDIFIQQVQEVQKGNGDPVYVESETRHNWGGEILSWVLPIALLFGVWFFIMRMMSRGGGGAGGQIFNIGKSKAKIYDKNTSVNITFKDVAGLEEAKVEVIEVVDFLKSPDKYTKLGGKIPKGVLLVGPPGTGKTLLAKSVAGEAHVPFFSLSGSDFVEMFVGVGASRVRDLFKQAKDKAPSIIFIDEIDAIGRARGKNPMTGSNDERENTLNQLLTEMDGFIPNSGVIVIAATNRADILDKALLRAGRFDRQIFVELPDLDARRQIFKVHMRPLKLNKNIDIEFLARQTPGFSGADIANVCNESALIAARKTHKSISRQDFMDAIDRIIGGLEKKNKIISPKEKQVVAHHEAGHAAVSWLLEYANPLVKVTIVPRGKSLGAAWYLPEERQITTTAQMFDEMCAALGGRAAEEVVFGEISTGALNDLEKVTKQAYAMVAYYGLSERIGNLSYYDSSGQQEFTFGKPFSEKTNEIIDEEISKLVEKAYKHSKEILIEHRDELEALANRLLDKEVIFSEDLEEIFGKRPWGITLSIKDHLSAGKSHKKRLPAAKKGEKTTTVKKSTPKKSVQKPTSVENQGTSKPEEKA
ncbi:Cell division protein FtsH [hydrothermal vent metagenome]|uniref:Cell division protein FtsH n=1 Tax=hydrothermal vent metagenome TaxID=652676 RepID=A0A3B0U758_9ZZZZ